MTDKHVKYVRLGDILTALDTSDTLAEARAAVADLKVWEMGAEVARLREEVEEWQNKYESACLDRDVAEAKVAEDWPSHLVERERDRAEKAEAEVARLTRWIEDIGDDLYDESARDPNWTIFALTHFVRDRAFAALAGEAGR